MQFGNPDCHSTSPPPMCDETEVEPYSYIFHIIAGVRLTKNINAHVETHLN